MAPLLFPDNTVLVNFATINRMDLLERLANGNGQWCATVAGECRKSAEVDGLEALAEAPAIFGAPLYPDAAEHLETRILREELAFPGDPAHAHLGEAETLAIVRRRRIGGLFVTDDKEAARLAAREGVRVATTWDLLRLAGRLMWVDSATLWGYLQTLGQSSRGWPPGVSDRASFDKWLEA